MKTLLGSWCLLGLAATLQAEVPDPELRIQVLVYNDAGVSPGALSHAEQEAGRIFGKIGLAVEWRDCPLPTEEAKPAPACGVPSVPTRLSLRLLSNSMAQRLTPRYDVLGLSLLPANGGFGVAANVLVGRVWERADVCPLSRSLVLGLVVAHELGHLLLGRPDHAVSGTMSVPLITGCPESITRDRKGLPQDKFFLSQQAEQLRANVARRIASQQAAEARLTTSK